MCHVLASGWQWVLDIRFVVVIALSPCIVLRFRLRLIQLLRVLPGVVELCCQSCETSFESVFQFRLQLI